MDAQQSPAERVAEIQFGVRSEINVYVSDKDIEVTGQPIQTEIIAILKNPRGPSPTVSHIATQSSARADRSKRFSGTATLAYDEHDK